MSTGSERSAQQSQPVAGRGQSLRPPTPPSPAVAETPPVAAPSEESPAISWWTKLTAVGTAAGTLVAAGAAVGALWFTGQSLRATNAQLGLSEQTAVTDRFRMAAEQLGSEEINIRLSGIYLLDRLAKDSPADHSTVYALLAAFVRTQSPLNACNNDMLATAIDVQAAVAAIAHRDTTRETDADRPDLNRTCLDFVELAPSDRGFPPPARLAGADLTNSYLASADLPGADLAGAYLPYAVLTAADLREADLTDAKLPWAKLTGSSLHDANLSRAFLTHAGLDQAELLDADLTGADLGGANLTDTDLTGADLSGADLAFADLSGATLTGVTYDSSTKWPEGFTPPPSAAK